MMAYRMRFLRGRAGLPISVVIKIHSSIINIRKCQMVVQGDPEHFWSTKSSIQIRSGLYFF